jgi:hypothetical protein
MNISSTTLSSLTSTAATSATAAVGAAQTSAPPAPPPVGGADQTHLSRMGDLMSQLQNLEQTNPDQAKSVLSNIASQLADKASSSNDPHLQELSDKFAQAAQTGDLSGLKPQGHGGHHHHHAQAAGGASSTDAAAAASTASGMTASYAQHGSDPMAQVESIISNALSSVSA